MKRIAITIAVLLAAVMFASACTKSGGENGEDGVESAESPTTSTYTQIDQDTAKQMMASDDTLAVVDVRRPDEYAGGHIAGAINVPNEEIADTQPEALPDLNQTILVYCRSGNRSKQASQKLADMGYTQVFEFGGITDWTGEIVTE